jgi:outer membrane lipoprotein-sorting protein
MSGIVSEPNIKDMVKAETTEGGISKEPIETVTYTKGSMSRTETKMADKGKEMTSIQIFDGKDSWMITGDKKMHLGSAETSKELARKYKDQMDKFNNENSVVIRTEQLNGKDCDVLESTLKEKEKVKAKSLMWIDKKDGVMYQMVSLDASGKEDFKMVLSDYRVVYGKAQMPYLTEFYANGKQVMKKTIKSVKVNQGLSDDLFDTSKYKEIKMDIGSMMGTKPYSQQPDNSAEKAPQQSSSTVSSDSSAPAKDNTKSVIKDTLKKGITSKLFGF